MDDLNTTVNRIEAQNEHGYDEQPLASILALGCLDVKEDIVPPLARDDLQTSHSHKP